MQFAAIRTPDDRLNYYCRNVSGFLPMVQSADAPQIISLHNMDRSTILTFSSDHLELISRRGKSYPYLQSEWSQILQAFLDSFQLSEISRLSLTYLNEIPLEDLRSFQDYLNLSIEMPLPLMERVEFFRTECVYKYDFGEIRIWLQPDWDEQLESYSIQLSLESRISGKTKGSEMFGRLQEMHEGIKDVFRQILSEDYIRQLPQ